MKNPLAAWQQTTSKRTRRLCYTLLATLSFLVLLPLVLKIGILYGLSRSGLNDASLDDVDLNLFTGELRIKRLAIKQPSNSDLDLGQLYVNFGWLALLKGQYQLEQLTINNVQLQLVEEPNGHWHVVIPILATSSSPSEPNADEQALTLPLLEAKHIALHKVDIKVNGQQVQGLLSIETLNVDALSNWRTEPTQLHLKGRWNDATIVLNLAAELVKPEPDLNLHLAIDHFQLSDIASLAAQQSQQQTRELKGELTLNIDLKGSKLSPTHWQVELSNNLTLKDFNLAIDDISLTNHVLSWAGNTHIDYLDEQLSYRLTGDLSNQQLAITDLKQALELATLERLSLQQLALKDDQSVAFEQLGLQQLNILRALTDKTSALTTGAITVHKSTLSADKKLHIGQLAISDGQYHIVLNKDGKPAIGEQLNHYTSNVPPTDTTDSQETTADQTASAPWLISLDEFLVTGDSFIHFVDRSISPNVDETLHINSLSLKGLDQSQPELHSPLALKAKLGEFSDINVNGWVTPFSSTSTAKLDGSVKALALPPFSPYAEKAIGYQIPNGQLDHRFELTLNKETIAMTNQIKLRRFDLIARDEKKNQLLSSTMGISLGFGLDVLRENDDSIKLEVPIKGRLDDPKVGISTIISKAMGTAITKGSISYLKYAIQPYGALISVGNMLGKQLAKINFEAITFASASAELNPESHAYLDKIAGLLVQRSGIEVAVCGSVNGDDQQALMELTAATNTQQQAVAKPETETAKQLLTLASQRANTVKRYLLTKQVNSDQLLLCKPSNSLTKHAAVSLSM